MVIKENFSLKPFHTFATPAFARYFAEVQSLDKLRELLSDPLLKKHNHLLLGAGSNVLFKNDFPGVVIKLSIMGREVLKSGSGIIRLRVNAGEDWDQLVAYCVENNWGGMENLSLIPGNVGTSPMQNIGAYGVELKDFFDELEALELSTGKIRTFNKKECRFGYRDSFFKKEGKGKYIILSVTFNLTENHHRINTSYGALEAELKSMGVTNPEIGHIRKAVCNIRRSKLPDPALLGNAGSFFKNPVVTEKKFRELKGSFPGMVAYPDTKGMKLAAGWLIENTGWKGYRKGDAGVHQKQALVLVNHGNANGKEITRLAEKIKKSVQEKFGVELETEVNIV